MTRRIAISAALALVALLGSVTPASAQMDARDDPVVRGPLNFIDRQCDSKTEMYQGEVLAETRSCLRFYAFDRDRENARNRNYGVVWLQTTVNAQNGWCSHRVTSDITVPQRVAVHERAPNRRTTNQRTPIQIGMNVNAGGHAENNGHIHKRLFLLPDELDGFMTDQGSTYRTRWNGHTAGTVASASGIEISWEAGSGAPQQLHSSLGYSFREC